MIVPFRMRRQLPVAEEDQPAREPAMRMLPLYQVTAEPAGEAAADVRGVGHGVGAVVDDDVPRQDQSADGTLASSGSSSPVVLPSAMALVAVPNALLLPKRVEMAVSVVPAGVGVAACDVQ